MACIPNFFSAYVWVYLYISPYFINMRLWWLSLLLLVNCQLWAQDTAQWLPAPPSYYGFVQYQNNKIEQANNLNPFWLKLQQVQNSHKGKINIIHIGDSHLQGDGMTSVLRTGFQKQFGDAGRGLVFPFQVANTNAPQDIKSNSNGPWKANKVISNDKKTPIGLMGYGIHTQADNTQLNVCVKPKDSSLCTFDQLTFFLSTDSICYKLTPDSSTSPVMFGTHFDPDKVSCTVNLPSLASGFQLCKVSSPDTKGYSFYGVSLQKQQSAGVLYHAIGVNGARFDHYVPSDLFWQQMGAMQGDLFIVSLGTNDAQNQFLNMQFLTTYCDSMVRTIRKIAPNASILLTTPPVSFYKTKLPNKVIEKVAQQIATYAQSRKLAYWDLYQIGGGQEQAQQWKQNGLLANDLIHFTNMGYQLQGHLLLSAFAQGYNDFTKSHPYQPTPVLAPKPVVPKPPKSAPVEGNNNKPTLVAKVASPAPNAPPKTQEAIVPEKPKDKIVFPTPAAKKKKSNIVVEYLD